MDKNEIINSLYKYKKEEFNTKYINETINYFRYRKTNIKEISNNEYLLTGIKLNLLYNKAKYFVYLSTNKNLNKSILCYRKIELSKTAMDNLKNQLYGIEENTFNICKKLKSNTKEYYFLIHDSELVSEKKNEIKDNYYELISLFCGIQSLYFLEHQNLNNYCSEIILKNSRKLFKELIEFKKKIKKLSWEEKDRLFIFSGLILHFLGTIYTQDIDLIYVSNNDKNIKKYYNIFKKEDMHLILKDKVIKTNTNKFLPYLNKWLKYELPQLANIPDIYTMLINPKYHFHFMGLKCFDILAIGKRIISRSTVFSLIDLILLKKMNNIDFIKEFCFKNIVIRQGRAKITIDNLSLLYKNVIKLLKEWYDIDIDIEYLQKHFIKCDKLHGTIYYNKKRNYDKHNFSIFTYNREVAKKYLKLYATNSENLLDIGIGKGNGIPDYIDVGVKEIYGIEPSIYSLEILKSKIKGTKRNIHIFNDFGDIKWNNQQILKKKFNIVIITFAIHYMIANIDILIENINKVSKKGTYIIIFCLDGQKIFSKIDKKRKNYEIMFKKEPYWGVYQYNEQIPNKFNKNFKMLFYMKDVYGVSNGSEEYLLHTINLIDKFEKNNYSLILRKSFLDELNEIKDHKINYPFQKDILDLHQTIILKKK